MNSDLIPPEVTPLVSRKFAKVTVNGDLVNYSEVVRVVKGSIKYRFLRQMTGNFRRPVINIKQDFCNEMFNREATSSKKYKLFSLWRRNGDTAVKI